MAVILAAAGKSSRFQDAHYKKPFVPLAGKAVWLHSAERFLQRDDVRQLVVVIAQEDREAFYAKFGANIAISGFDVVIGGQERADSVRAGLAAVGSDVAYIAVHDAARPLIVDAWIDKLFHVTEQTGAAILATPLTSTLKRSRDGRTVDETVPREGLWEAQTPQAFRRDWLVEAYDQLDGFSPTDEAQAVERMGRTVHLVPGSPMNRKITTRDDLRLAEQAIRALPKPKLPGPFG